MTQLRTIKAYKEKETTILYCQCRLRKSNCVETVYIPKKFAIKGNVVKIKVDGVWDDGWTVEEVWQEVDEAFLDGMRNALKHQRSVSDI